MKSQISNFIFLIGLAATIARGQDAWLLTTADFRTERVSLRAIGDRGLTVSIGGPDGHARVIDFDRFLQIDRVPAPRAPAAGRFVLELTWGDRLAGEPRSVEAEVLAWSGTSLGELKLPLKSIASMRRAGRAPAAAEDHPRDTEDVITLANGDAVRGIISAISVRSVSIQSAGGDVIDVPLDSVVAIDFAKAPGGAGEPALAGGNHPRAFRVTLADGSLVTAPSIQIANDSLLLKLDDGASRSVPLADVASIEQLNGPVLWLSSLTATENIQLPFLDYAAPARMNATVTGRPIRFGDRTFTRGIGVHAYSRMTWPIDPSIRAFRTQYALDGDLPYANVTVRIMLGDRVVHEKSDVRAGALSPVVMLDVNGQKTITLEVDYGQTYDVQDRFNWIEPALLKSKPEPTAPTIGSPATAPATVPAH